MAPTRVVPTMNPHSLPYVESLYARFVADPASVPEAWRPVFEEWARDDPFAARPPLAPQPPRSLFHATPSAAPDGVDAESCSPFTDEAVRSALLQERVDQLIRAYRTRGHMVAAIDPLERPRPRPAELNPSFYGLTDADLDSSFSTANVPGPRQQDLRAIIDRLESTYCRSIGVELMHIDDPEPKRWLTMRMEQSGNRLDLSADEQRRILIQLTDAVILEEFIVKKYLGAKSFSLEGSESLIPLLDTVVERAGEQGVEEIVLGMAHRGRLNVLVNMLGKDPQEVFREFEDSVPEDMLGRGDVKYHLGHSGTRTTTLGHDVHLSLCFNPSHLEYVNPVALGRLRAKQDRVGDTAGERSMAVLIHGDAAFAGEGVVQETLNLSQLGAYQVGGTVHVIVNNQIGFTTDPVDARSTAYSSDVARMLQGPIFHVNGEDPEAVEQVVMLALDFRARFRRDVVIDMYCYRRRGHNENDEPAFTQPEMYETIRARGSVRDRYVDRLLELGKITDGDAKAIAEERQAELESALGEAKSDSRKRTRERGPIWRDYLGGPDTSVADVDTGVSGDVLRETLAHMTTLPEGFTPHPKIERLLGQRRDMADGKRPLDWATAELLAFGSLALDGHPVRLTGQDSERGTFSQRHAVLHDVETGAVWAPLAQREDAEVVTIANSPLSEAGVLGFEYGYSLDAPATLVAWEAQFGDFVNAAQVILDQFVTSAEDKWRRLSGLVMLLPHGFEGMGPEHSSARLERFLEAAAEDNIQVVQPTTPAQHFHALRRQARRPWRKPLVVMTPKSLLRNTAATSRLDELMRGRFQRILPDTVDRSSGPKASLVVLCSGKLYYDLVAAREDRERHDVAIIRLEQLYPLAPTDLATALSPYPKVPVLWAQEEPENMGAWPMLCRRFGMTLPGKRVLGMVSRPESASPATGSSASHKLEQQTLIDAVFARSRT